VLIERKTRYMMAFKNPSKHAHIILNKLKRAFKQTPDKLKKSNTTTKYKPLSQLVVYFIVEFTI